MVKYLHPVLKATVPLADTNAVRVIWVSSSAVEAYCPNPPIDFDNMDYKREESEWTKYGRSKAGNVLHSVEFSRRTKGEGIISLVREDLTFSYIIADSNIEFKSWKP